MTIRWQAFLALCACAAPIRPALAPRVARAEPAAVPPALLDGAEAIVRGRARVAHRRAIRFERATPALAPGLAPDPDGDRAGEPMLVAAQDGARVQLRDDADDARLLIWVDRADLSRVFVKAQALVDPRTGLRGAVARPGAIARVGRTAEGEVEVAIDDGVIAATGRVPASAIGTVYDERPPRAATTDTKLAAGEIVHASPDGAPVATSDVVVDAHVLAPPQNGWVELEIDRPYVYVRGFAHDASASPRLIVPDQLSVGPSAATLDDTSTLLLPSGACLYARPGGAIVGVNQADRLRYARDGGAPGWRRVAVMTSWGLVWAAAHFPEVNGRPAGDYDRCVTRRASRSR